MRRYIGPSYLSTFADGRIKASEQQVRGSLLVRFCGLWGRKSSRLGPDERDDGTMGQKREQCDKRQTREDGKGEIPVR
jgi:hypothetical protein